MEPSQKQTVLLSLFILTYGLLFYFVLTIQLRLDFASFYSASIAYIHGLNPYQVLTADYLPPPNKLPMNLNPPFFLELIQPFTWLPYPIAASIWFALSFCLGIIGAIFTFKIVFPISYLKKNWCNLLFVYLGLYATLMSAAVAQIGALLFFFIMLGYYFYLKKQDVMAGLCWGIIIAIKLFPALLLFFAAREKRYQVIAVMGLSCFILWFIPVLTHGMTIYTTYFDILPRVLWFGDNWNASIYGFLFRLFIDPRDRHQNLMFVKSVYAVFFLVSLAWYIKKITIFQNPDPLHRSFSLTLVMMLLMSPFGWLYYFSLLLLPFTILWQSLQTSRNPLHSSPALVMLSFFLVNFPIGYVMKEHMLANAFSQMSFYSLYFYGLILLAYLLSRPANRVNTCPLPATPYSLHPIVLILGTGFTVTLSCCLLHFLQ